MMRPVRHVATFCAVVLLAVSCAQQQEAAPTATPADEGVVGVRLQEWAVVPDADSAPAGMITFEVTNVGDDDHEFMLARSDLDPGELLTNADGSVDEDGEGLEVIDATNAPAHGGGEEHEVVEPGDEKDFVYELDAGSYVLFCNLVEEEDGELEVHYALGMRIGFTVE